MIIQCCVCRVIVQEEDHREPIGEISHTYCPTCYGESMAEIKKAEIKKDQAECRKNVRDHARRRAGMKSWWLD